MTSNIAIPQVVRLAKRITNIRIERYHGTCGELDKVMRGLEIEDSPFIKGHQLYYNFIRPHEALDGRTPSEMAGIRIEGDNKWLALMRNAIKYNKS